MTRPPVENAAAEANPSVPGFRSWRRLYVFVLAVFFLTVALLAWFSNAFA